MTVHILLADDHAVFRTGIKAFLEKEPDFRVIGETGTGFDTIKAAADRKIDLLLLDISMPGLPGARVAESVLEKRPDLPIVILTMHEDEYYLRELLRIGVRGYVLKKSTGTDLVQAIRAAYHGEQYIDPALAGHVVSSYVGARSSKKKKHRLALLTVREKEVCKLLAYGHTNVEIAKILNLSVRTVETHRTHIMAKLDLKSRAELVQFAIEQKLLSLD